MTVIGRISASGVQDDDASLEGSEAVQLTAQQLDEAKKKADAAIREALEDTNIDELLEKAERADAPPEELAEIAAQWRVVDGKMAHLAQTHNNALAGIKTELEALEAFDDAVFRTAKEDKTSELAFGLAVARDIAQRRSHIAVALAGTTEKVEVVESTADFRTSLLNMDKSLAVLVGEALQKENNGFQDAWSGVVDTYSKDPGFLLYDFREGGFGVEARAVQKIVTDIQEKKKRFNQQLEDEKLILREFQPSDDLQHKQKAVKNLSGDLQAKAQSILDTKEDQEKEAFLTIKKAEIQGELQALDAEEQKSIKTYLESEIPGFVCAQTIRRSGKNAEALYAALAGGLDLSKSLPREVAAWPDELTGRLTQKLDQGGMDGLKTHEYPFPAKGDDHRTTVSGLGLAGPFVEHMRKKYLDAHEGIQDIWDPQKTQTPLEALYKAGDEKQLKAKLLDTVNRILAFTSIMEFHSDGYNLWKEILPQFQQDLQKENLGSKDLAYIYKEIIEVLTRDSIGRMRNAPSRGRDVIGFTPSVTSPASDSKYAFLMGVFRGQSHFPTLGKKGEQGADSDGYYLRNITQVSQLIVTATRERDQALERMRSYQALVPKALDMLGTSLEEVKTKIQTVGEFLRKENLDRFIDTDRGDYHQESFLKKRGMSIEGLTTLIDAIDSLNPAGVLQAAKAADKRETFAQESGLDTMRAIVGYCDVVLAPEVSKLSDAIKGSEAAKTMWGLSVQRLKAGLKEAQSSNIGEFDSKLTGQLVKIEKLIRGLCQLKTDAEGERAQLRAVAEAKETARLQDQAQADSAKEYSTAYVEKVENVYLPAAQRASENLETLLQDADQALDAISESQVLIWSHAVEGYKRPKKGFLSTVIKVPDPSQPEKLIKIKPDEFQAKFQEFEAIVRRAYMQLQALEKKCSDEQDLQQQDKSASLLRVMYQIEDQDWNVKSALENAGTLAKVQARHKEMQPTVASLKTVSDKLTARRKHMEQVIGNMRHVL